MPTTQEEPMDTITEAENILAAADENDDPRGDDACPECPEGTLEHTGARHPALVQVRCAMCGFAE
jgi:hypothetical protein